VTSSCLIHVFVRSDDGFISRNLVAKYLLVMTDHTEELKYLPLKACVSITAANL
jgi:hypothetical protein